jgi:membrane protease YdiL (CAAX protease family)
VSAFAGAGAGTRRRLVRWGIPDAVWVWLGALFTAAIVGSIVAAVRGRGTGATDAVDLAVALVAQDGFLIGAMALLVRAKGLGSLRADLGLVVRVRDLPWLAVGVALQVASFVLIDVLDRVGGGLPQQEAARTLDRSQGPELIVLVVGVVLLAPLAEELLFRGLLLRSLLRRVSAPAAVAVSAIAFGVVHLLDPSTAALLVPLIGLGLVSGARAVRTGELSQSLMIHVGFNLLSAVALLST